MKIAQQGMVAFSLGLILAVLSACTNANDNRPDLTSGNAAQSCRARLGDAKLDPLRGKLVLEAVNLSGVPNQAMLSNAARPNEAEREAARHFEEAARGCKAEYEQTGYTFYAMQDVRDLRISDIRARLHKGEISFGAYNARYIEIMAAFAEQEARRADAFSRGKQAGDQNFYAQMTMMQQMQQTQQLQNIQNELSNIRSEQSLSQYKMWNCNADRLGRTSTVIVNCY